MDNKRQWYLLGAFCVLSFLLYIHLLHQSLFVFGTVIFVLYLGLLTLWWRDILHHVFRFERGFVSLILSGFAAVMFVTSIEAIVLALYTTTAFLTWMSLVFSGVATYVLRIAFLSKPHGSKIVGKGRKQCVEVFPQMRWLSWMYIIGWIGTGILFISARGIDVQFSPWQSLSTWILPLVFVLTVVLGFIIFSKQKTTHILVLILMHSFLLHLYLPLSHELPWGGDVWRHIAVEQQLAAGDIVPPVLFGTEAKWREVLGADVPEAFLIPQKYTYGKFWSLAVITQQVTGMSLELINRWLMPILSSLVFPLILFRIGRILFRSWRGGLLLAWVSFVAFPLQALGALTLPVSLGVLTFFFTLMLWLQYLGKRHHVQGWFLALSIFLMLFGYSLSFILMLLAVAGSWFLRSISRHVRSSGIGWSLVALVLVLGIFAIPILELVSGISHLPDSINVVEHTKQITGQFFGWYYASDIRPHDIASGNLLFNHTPAYAYVPSVFTSWRWWIIPAAILFWIMTLYGLYRFVRERQPLRFLLPAWLFVVLGGTYKIGWFVLEGDRLFTRRLDPFLSTMLLIFFVFGILACLYHMRYKSLALRRSAALFFIMIMSWFAAATYASGPDMRTASVDEYAVATLLLEEKEHIRDTCVLADTWVLLPLEGLSAGSIVGGNFPIGYQFGQAERVTLFESFHDETVTTSTVHAVFDASKTSICTIVLLADDISDNQEKHITSLLGDHPVRYSGFLLWTLEDPRLKSLGE